jgi:branched-chain amino acid transport system permease protein
MSRSLLLAYVAGAVLLGVTPFLVDAYWTDVLNSVGLYALLALSLNLILGDAGLFNMGHAAFYAVGAYTAAILNTRLDVPILWALPAAGAAAAIFAALVARPVIHLRGDYLLIVTIGMGEIVRIALVNDVFGLTGGANGIFGISRPSLFGVRIRKPHEFFFLIWGFVAVTVFLFHRLEQSRFGRALNYLREDPVAAEGSGVNTARYKLLAFVLGAAWAGMTGSLYAAKMTIISPESFSFWESVVLFLIVILGGSGSIPGVILGAFLVVALPELFRGFASARMLVFGLVMMVMMVFRTQGLLPFRTVRFKRSDVARAEAAP